jgi:hypothetical protein
MFCLSLHSGHCNCDDTDWRDRPLSTFQCPRPHSGHCNIPTNGLDRRQRSLPMPATSQRPLQLDVVIGNPPYVSAFQCPQPHSGHCNTTLRSPISGACASFQCPQPHSGHCNLAVLQWYRGMNAFQCPQPHSGYCNPQKYGFVLP